MGEESERRYVRLQVTDLCLSTVEEERAIQFLVTSLKTGKPVADAGTRREGHQVIAQYFAQDEADRLDPSLTVYETLAVSSPTEMVPMIRNILGGFLFSGDDVYQRAAVLSGGECTRLAVARMLLRPSNTLLLDEPTNHLDLDSKDVLLAALAGMRFVFELLELPERRPPPFSTVSDGSWDDRSRSDAYRF